MKILAISTYLHPIALLAGALVSTASSATQPLLDQYAAGARSGHIFPEQCCYVELPENERIRHLRRAQMATCTAHGGPVGKFRLKDRKLWLTGLYQCSGDIALQRIYPGIESPALATWLTGTFRTQLDFRCYDQSVQPVYGITQTLVVDKGIVKSVRETKNDISACPR